MVVNAIFFFKSVNEQRQSYQSRVIDFYFLFLFDFLFDFFKHVMLIHAESIDFTLTSFL